MGINFIHSIKFKFTLWYLLILSILLVILAGGLYVSLSRTLYANFDDALRNRSAQLAGFRDIISIVASGTFEDELGELVSFYYYDKDQLRHISQNKTGISIDPELIRQAIDGKTFFVTLQAQNNIALRIFITSFIPDNPDIRTDKYSTSSGSDRRLVSMKIRKAALVIGRPITDIAVACHQLLRILFLALPITIILAGGGGIFLSRRAFIPVEKITEAAREIEANDLSRRIDIRSKDELGRLASTLNQMIGRLENAFLRQKEFTSDASHELRAPLAIIQAESSLALQRPRGAGEYMKSLEIITQETEHLTSIINQLLNLARADSGKGHLKFEKIKLDDFINELCVDVEIVCRDKKLLLQRELFSTAVVKGDTVSLRSLFHNLLDNAIRYTEEGGCITVKSSHGDSWVKLSVSDTGIGIPSDEQSLIFERFYRVDKARSRSEGGCGLGLAICRQIAHTHSGTIEVESQSGKGSTFHVRLPVFIGVESKEI
jgi:heavy metal sensor kinase